MRATYFISSQDRPVELNLPFQGVSSIEFFLNGVDRGNIMAEPQKMVNRKPSDTQGSEALFEKCRAPDKGRGPSE